MIYFVLITDMHDQEHRIKANGWEEVLSFVRIHRGKIKEFKFKKK